MRGGAFILAMLFMGSKKNSCDVDLESCRAYSRHRGNRPMKAERRRSMTGQENTLISAARSLQSWPK